MLLENPSIVGIVEKGSKLMKPYEFETSISIKHNEVGDFIFSWDNNSLTFPKEAAERIAKFILSHLAKRSAASLAALAIEASKELKRD